MADRGIRDALCLHGAGGGGWEWDLWRGVLAAHGVAVRAPDLPMPHDGARDAFADVAAAARAELDALPRPRAVIGASLGGLLAMACAPAADALVLVNPLPPRPWHTALPARTWPERVPWRRDARLASTRRALPDADDASALSAFRRWADAPGALLRAAYAGVEVAVPECPVLCIVSRQDDDVSPSATAALTQAWRADLIEADSDSHVGPLLGRAAVDLAARVAAWLSAR